MKNLLYTIAVACSVLIACDDSKKSSEHKEVIQLGKAYGEVKVDTSNAVTVDDMLSTFNDKKKAMQFTFIAPIEEVCSKAGCWVNVDKGNGETFMVRFKDHFTIPPKTKIGTKAYMHGTAYMDTITVDLLRHFAEDAGKSKAEIEKITEPKYELGFEADGIVLIK